MSHKLCLGLDTNELLIINNLLEDISISQIQPDYFKLNPSFLYMDSNSISIVANWLNKFNFNWIFDAKYGDVYHTNQKLADYVFSELNASAVTLNPYSGVEALKPFFFYTNKKCFILLKTTSNSPNQKYFWKDIVDSTLHYNNVHYIAPATDVAFFQELLQYLPEDKLILSPGIGAQKGNISLPSSRIIYSASRSILNAINPLDMISHYKKDASNIFWSHYLKDFVKTGSFLLSSGKESNTYIDMKGLYSNKEKFSFVLESILSILNPDSNTTFVGLASAGIPLATALAQNSPANFAYIRSNQKEYGTKNILEGSVSKETKLILIDDVYTTGKSINQATLALLNLGYKNIHPFVICSRDPHLHSSNCLFKVTHNETILD